MVSICPQYSFKLSIYPKRLSLCSVLHSIYFPSICNVHLSIASVIHLSSESTYLQYTITLCRTFTLLYPFMYLQYPSIYRIQLSTYNIHLFSLPPLPLCSFLNFVLLSFSSYILIHLALSFSISVHLSVILLSPNLTFSMYCRHIYTTYFIL